MSIYEDDEIIAYGVRLVDMSKPHVPSMRLICDDCNEPIWMSYEMVDKLSKTLLERTEASIKYLCIGHLDVTDREGLVEYGCPTSTCDFICDSENEMASHYYKEHHR